MDDELDEFNSMSVRQLKDLLQQKGVDYSDCVEKIDLIKRARESKTKTHSHLVHEHAPEKKPKSRKEYINGNVREWHDTMAALECIGQENVDSNGQFDLIVIVMHGYGANKEDLASIGKSLAALNQFKKTLFVFPDGILKMDSFSRAWWPIDMNDMMTKVMRGEFQLLLSRTPDGLESSRAHIMELMKELKKVYSLPTNRIVLAGFSQGSMLATDVALHLDEVPAGVMVWSGSIINHSAWLELVKKRKGMKVLQSHGKQDPILTYQLGLWMKDFFEKAECDHQFISFDGGHTIGPATMPKIVEFLQKCSTTSTL